MESASLRQLLASLIALVFFALPSKSNLVFNADEIRPRFEAMECMITPRYTTEVESYIKKYLSNNGSQAKRVMERAAVYFPIYEKYLTDHGMPQDLKYLSIVESALIPNATSPAGAKGLWQFMSETGKNYCLTIDKNVDERYCPHNSTEAAMYYLSKQFERFGSWELALASYNCGAGTINNAMKRARSNNYWVISKHLPRETRNFVPAFLGAVYVGNFYHLHGVEPEYPSLDMQVTDVLKVYERLDFNVIAAVTGLPLEIVGKLNPAYKNDFVPENTDGYDVIVPRRVYPALAEYLEARRPDIMKNKEVPPLPPVPDTSSYRPDELYFQSVYVVAEGDKIDALSEVFNVAPYNIKVWNKLTSYKLREGQELAIWFPNELHHFLPKEGKIAVIAKPEPVIINVVEEAPEEAIERDNLPVPSEVAGIVMKLKPQTANPQTLSVVATTMPAAAKKPKSKIEKVVAPLMDIDINLPKVKSKDAMEKPKKAPVVPKPKSDETPNGHGII